MIERFAGTQSAAIKKIGYDSRSQGGSTNRTQPMHT